MPATFPGRQKQKRVVSFKKQIQAPLALFGLQQENFKVYNSFAFSLAIVPRPNPPPKGIHSRPWPDFRATLEYTPFGLQYAYCKRSKTGRREDLGTRVWELKSEYNYLCWSCISAQGGEYTAKATNHLVVLHLRTCGTCSHTCSYGNGFLVPIPDYAHACYTPYNANLFTCKKLRRLCNLLHLYRLIENTWECTIPQPLNCFRKQG